MAAMASLDPLPAAAVRRRCDATRFAFASTAELPDLPEGIGQERAVEAVRTGIGIRRYGYNIFALGPPGMGKHGLVRQFVAARAAAEPAPGDWCYVPNFAEALKPRVLCLPQGRGASLKRDLDRLVEELRIAIPAAFESEEYRERKKGLEARFSERSEKAFAELVREARERGIVVLRTPLGVGMAPARDGEAMEAEEFARLPEPAQAKLREAMAALQERLEDVVGELPRQARRQREELRELDRQVAERVVGHLVAELRGRYADVPQVVEHVAALQEDVLENLEEFVEPRREGLEAAAALLGKKPGGARALQRRYAVNVLVDNGGVQGAPVVYEDHPSYPNLVGRIEHFAEFGSLVTDFRLIRSGALHRANGGYLIVDARKLLQQPLAWDELKRALRGKQIRVESMAQALGLATTASLDPEPIPLDLKVVLVGDRILYYLLAEYDPEFLELFKVAADFEETIERTPEGEERFACFLATLTRREGLRPLDRGGVAKSVEHSARLAADAERLSVHGETLADVLREADYLAGQEGRAAIEAAHVERAVTAQLRRAGRMPERIREEIQRGTLLIDTAGEAVGQVNGLSVYGLGSLAFGRPSRITAAVRLGGGRVVDIEREVALGGPIHSKGVLILAGFLGGRYCSDRPLSLHASLVFEQSYGGVEGDSASCAELVALLSALAEAPIRQWLAITGSVNQRGRVQAVGGVNEKIEGYFDLCRARGLSGREGVVIPAANVKHLMLREDVVAAVAEGRFRVHAVESVDEAAELLTGLPAGERGADGAFPGGTLNARVEARLAEFAEKARKAAAEAGAGGEKGP
jgi:lon-related putative ATP-dependent protease